MGFARPKNMEEVSANLGEVLKKVNGTLEPPSLGTVDLAYGIFEDGRKSLIDFFMNKESVIEGESMNELQDNFGEGMQKRVEKYFSKCGIEVKDTKFMFKFGA